MPVAGKGLVQLLCSLYNSGVEPAQVDLQARVVPAGEFRMDEAGRAAAKQVFDRCVCCRATAGCLPHPAVTRPDMPPCPLL